MGRDSPRRVLCRLFASAPGNCVGNAAMVWRLTVVLRALTQNRGFPNHYMGITQALDLQ
jgi:hypothetical protein